MTIWNLIPNIDIGKNLTTEFTKLFAEDTEFKIRKELNVYKDHGVRFLKYALCALCKR